MPDRARSDETLDILCNDRVRLIQKKKGYRFSIDPLLLANFVRLKKRESLIDVGTGCGIIPIYLAKKGHADNRFTGIEIQDELYELSVRNRQLNGCENIEFVHGDARTARRLGPFHVMVSNPPYVKATTGRTSPGRSRLVARYESALDLAALIRLASSLLFTHGRLYVIYPVKRLAEFISTSKARNLEPKRLRLVHSRPGEPAVLSLVECVKGAGVDLKVEPPLYIYSDEDYTEEVKAYYA